MEVSQQQSFQVELARQPEHGTSLKHYSLLPATASNLEFMKESSSR